MLYQSCFKVVSKLSQSLKVVLKFPFTHLGTICFCPLALPSSILHYCQILPILSYIKLHETRHYVLQFRVCQSNKAMPFLHVFPVNRIVWYYFLSLAISWCAPKNQWNILLRRKNFAKFQIYPFSLWNNADVRVWEDQGGKYQVGWWRIFLEYIFTFRPINPNDLHSVKVFLHSSRTQFVHGGGGRGMVCVKSQFI